MVKPPRVKECPVQMEVQLAQVIGMNKDAEGRSRGVLGLEVAILRVHTEESIIQPGAENRIDADRWRPLMQSFQHFYGLSSRLQDSRLAEIEEEHYR